MYSFHTDKYKNTPANEPIPNREAEMVQGKSGAYAFDAGIWTQLRRCLLLGTSKTDFYTGKQELTDDFVQVLKEAIEVDAHRVAEEILYASDGRAINNSAPIYALTLLSAGNFEAKKEFLRIFTLVVRTGTHLYEWLNYTKATRGFGKLIKQAGEIWFDKDLKDLVYQLLKYQQRNGFTNRDALRLLHIKPKTEVYRVFYDWVCKGWDSAYPLTPLIGEEYQDLKQLWWYEHLKRNKGDAVNAITQGRLTHEMVAPLGVMSKEVWDLLFQSMPIGALLRNLASLTELEVLRADQIANLERVESVLNNKEHLRKGRIHPIDILKALKTYASGGSIGKSKKTWTVIPRIVDILEKAVELSFDTVEPTGKVFLHALDISGSMSWSLVDSVNLTPAEIAATMCLVTAKAEKNYVIKGFSDRLIDLDITRSDTFSSALRKTTNQNFGGTDASLVFQWATQANFKADAIILWTDNESWEGQQASQAARNYRQQVNPKVKIIYNSITTNNLSQVDPQDKLSFDIAGFDPSTPQLIQTLVSEI